MKNLFRTSLLTFILFLSSTFSYLYCYAESNNGLFPDLAAPDLTSNISLELTPSINIPTITLPTLDIEPKKFEALAQEAPIPVVSEVAEIKETNSLNLGNSLSQTPGGLILPIKTGGQEAGYNTDTGLDISVLTGTPCIAAAAGKIVYSEYGGDHTKKLGDNDTPNCVLVKLDAPFDYNGKTVNYMWYAHLSSLTYDIPYVSGAEVNGTEIRVNQGDLLGLSGIGRNNPHLHFGFVGDYDQTIYLNDQEIRNLFKLSKGDTW